MKQSMFGLLLLFSAVQWGFGQLTDQEIGHLRKQVKISNGQVIRIDQGASFPSGDTLKIFLLVKRSGSEAKSFVKWIEAWNREEGKRYGRLEMVDDPQQADVVLTQFVSASLKPSDTGSVSVGNIPREGQLKSKVTIATRHESDALVLPVYSYLLKRERDVWTIVFSEVETALPDRQMINPELNLWTALKEMMKDR